MGAQKLLAQSAFATWGCNELECHPDIYFDQVTRVVKTNDSRITQLRKQRRLMSSWPLMSDMTLCTMRCLNQHVHPDPTASASDSASYKRSDSCTGRFCRRTCPQAWLLGRACCAVLINIVMTSGLTSSLTSRSKHTGQRQRLHRSDFTNIVPLPC